MNLKHHDDLNTRVKTYIQDYFDGFEKKDEYLKVSNDLSSRERPGISYFELL